MTFTLYSTPDVQANTTTAGWQSHPSMTPLADGGYLVTWLSSGQDGDGYGIFAQRFSNMDVKVGPEFQVNAVSASNQIYSSATCLSDGSFVVTWSSYGEDGSDYGIYCRRFDANGNALTGDVQVSTYTPGEQNEASIAALADGGFVITWNSANQGDDPGTSIHAQRFNALAAPVGGELHVNTTTAGNQVFPMVTALGSGFLVTWSSDGLAIKAQRYDASGNVSGGEFQVDTAGLSVMAPSARQLADGSFVVTWSSAAQDGSGWNVVGRLYDASGVPKTGEFLINTTTANDQFYTSVAPLSDGSFIVGWASYAQDGSGWGVYGQQVSASGAKVGAEFRINQITAGDQFPESFYGTEWLATLKYGHVAAAWSGFQGPEEVFTKILGVGANQNPVITSGNAASVTEGATAVMTVQCSDADPGPAVRYSIAGGADASAFTIDSSTGALSFISAPNFEHPTDVGGNNVYDITVRVSDGVGGTATQAIAVTVTDANEAPTFAVGGDGMVTTDFGSVDAGHSVTMQPDGKILVAGYSASGLHGNSDFAVVRYHTDGSLDTSFSDDGKLTVGDFFYDGSAASVLVRPNGNIILAGTQESDLGNGFVDSLIAYYEFSPTGTYIGRGSYDFGDWVLYYSSWYHRGGSATGAGAALQADGKLLIAGQAYNLSSGNNDFALVRFSTDGTRDVTFSGAGRLTDFTGGSDSGYSVTVQPDGKILVAGIAGSDFALARYNADGTLDTTFSGDGKLTTDFAGNFDSGQSIAVQPDGKILVAGYAFTGPSYDIALARYNADGSLDMTFSGDGKVTTDFGYNDAGYSVTVQPDSKILVAGFSGTDFALMRYNADGSLDTTFSGDGKVTTDFGYSDAGYSVTVQPDEKILVAGVGGGYDFYHVSNFALARYNADGTLDTTFDAVNPLAHGLTVAENTALVRDIDATDPDAGQVLTYSIVGGVDAGRFAINASTGVLSFVSAPDFEQPWDVGGNNVYDVTVRVSDGVGGTATQAIAVTVTNVNEAPVITSNGGGGTASTSIGENMTQVATVSATDQDAGQTLAYSIIGGVDASKFTINGSTGALSFVSAPDFEQPTDADGNNVYEVTVRVSDGIGGTATQAIAVTVTNVNEAPVITSNGGGGTASTSIGENMTQVTTVSATDQDAGQTLAYSIIGGVDASKFTINGSTGALSFVSAPDFEQPTDADGNNVYEVTVQAFDGVSASATQNLAVTVTDVNEAPTVTSALIADDDHITTTSEEAVLTVTGTATGGDGGTASVHLYDGATLLYTGTGAVADGSYSVSFTGHHFPAGSYSAQVVVQSASGASSATYTKIFDSTVCFMTGTMIRTPEGDVAVEDLKAGQLVTLADGRALPVRWIGRQTVAPRFADPLRTAPICIRAGALAEKIPSRDLYTSAGHAMFLDGILANSGALVNGSSIVRLKTKAARITYHHVELAEHAIIFANDAPTESFVDNVNRATFDNYFEFKKLYPEEPPIKEMDLPRAQSHRQVPLRIRAWLAEREAIGQRLEHAVS